MRWRGEPIKMADAINETWMKQGRAGSNSMGETRKGVQGRRHCDVKCK